MPYLRISVCTEEWSRFLSGALLSWPTVGNKKKEHGFANQCRFPSLSAAKCINHMIKHGKKVRLQEFTECLKGTGTPGDRPPIPILNT